MAFRKLCTAGFLALGLSGCTHDETASLSFGPGYGLYYNDQGETVALAYGLPNSDDVQLFLQCAKGSGRVTVSDVDRGKPASVLLLSSGGRRTSVPVRSDAGEGNEPGTVSGETAIDAPALAAFRKSGAIEVSLGGRRYAITASAAERAGVERFFRVCARA